MTEILIQGLRSRLERNQLVRDLLVSEAAGGLAQGVEWSKLEAVEPEGARYR